MMNDLQGISLFSNYHASSQKRLGYIRMMSKPVLALNSLNFHVCVSQSSLLL